MEKRIITWSWGNNETHDEYTSSRGFIFGNYPRRACDYQKLVNEAKQDFPHLTDESIELGRVSKSTYMQGFIFVEFALPANTIHSEYDGWSRFDFQG